MFSLLKRAIFLSPLLLAMPALQAADAAVSPYAYELFRIPGLELPVTNAMVTGWTISILLILVVRLMIGRASLVPSRAQSVIESIMMGIYNIMEPIVGKKMIRPVFPLLIGFFTFILIMNWSGLLPGVGSFGHITADGKFHYYLRPASSDLNTTLALAIVSFLAWIYFVFRYAGVKLFIYDIFGNKAEKSEVPVFIYYPLFLVFFAVGLIEIVSILSRLVSLPFRLFGNVYGGESLLTSMHGLIAWVMPVPFYFLELLIGMVQALVFTLLTAVYIGLICNHDHPEHEDHGSGAHPEPEHT